MNHGDGNTITFDSNCGSSVRAVTLHGGEHIVVPKHPTKLGYIFEGWYTNCETYNKAYS